MVLPSEAPPERDEIRLLKSGRVKVSLEADKRIVLRRPTLGQLQHLMERYDEIMDELFDPAPATGGKRKLKEGEKSTDLGARWWTEVLVTLAPDDPGAKYDHLDAPAWTVTADRLFQSLFNHWTEVPLVSDADDPEPEPTKALMFPTVGTPEPVVRHQVVAGSTGP